MLQMRCRRCGLTLRLRNRALAVEHCPRCLARARVAVPVELGDERSDGEVLAVSAGVAAALHDELGGASRPPRTPASAWRAGPPLLSQPCRALAQRGLTRGARRQSLIHLMLDRWSCRDGWPVWPALSLIGRPRRQRVAA